MKKPLVLCIMDGFGYNASDYGNAIAAAKTPNLDKIRENNPGTLIGASGMDVGLPDGQMGNSEVGHTNIGAGRVVYQELTRISKAIADGDFFENSELRGAVENAIKNGTALHLVGLMSDGGVHSHNTHLWALVKLAKDMGLKDVYVHCILDGRDVAPTSGADFVQECADKLNEIGVGKIATVMGRYYAMVVTTAGSALLRLMPQWFTARATKTQTPLQLLKNPTPRLTPRVKTSPMNLLSRPSAIPTAKLRRTTALFSSTSAPTVRVKSPAPLLTAILTALKESSASSRFTMSA